MKKTISLSEDYDKKLRLVKEATGLPMSVVIRKALDLYFARDYVSLAIDERGANGSGERDIQAGE